LAARSLLAEIWSWPATFFSDELLRRSESDAVKIWAAGYSKKKALYPVPSTSSSGQSCSFLWPAVAVRGEEELRLFRKRWLGDGGE
jgi:hypothetical protein